MEYTIETGSWRSPGGHPLTMSYRIGTNDWNTLTATLTEDEYGLPRGLRGHAVDVGGYLGSVGIALAADNPECRVTIIEPVPANCDLIEQNIAANHSRATLVRGAVGKNHRKVTIRFGFRGSEAVEHHAFVGNSTLSDGATHYETVTYTPITLAELGPLSFLKIDTEGAEWDFLTGPVENVEAIVGEWHNTDGHTIGDMAALLEPTHVVTFSGPQAGPGEFRAVRR